VQAGVFPFAAFSLKRRGRRRSLASLKSRELTFSFFSWAGKFFWALFKKTLLIIYCKSGGKNLFTIKTQN